MEFPVFKLTRELSERFAPQFEAMQVRPKFRADRFTPRITFEGIKKDRYLPIDVKFDGYSRKSGIAGITWQHSYFATEDIKKRAFGENKWAYYKNERGWECHFNENKSDTEILQKFGKLLSQMEVAELDPAKDRFVSEAVWEQWDGIEYLVHKHLGADVRVAYDRVGHLEILRFTDASGCEYALKFSSGRASFTDGTDEPSTSSPHKIYGMVMNSLEKRDRAQNATGKLVKGRR